MVSCDERPDLLRAIYVQSGQPFEVSGSGLPKECRPSMTGRYLVGSDGTVTPIRPTCTTRRRRIVDQSAREAYREHLHLLDHLPIAAGYNDIHLHRLDAGEPVVAQGWKFGYHGYEHYCLEPDGRVTPVEAIHVDESAKVLTVENWRRPDGSLVYSDEPT